SRMMFKLFRKPDHVARVEPAGVAVTVRGGQRLLDAALEAGLDWPHDCRVGSCGECRCRLTSGRIKPLTDFVYTLPLEDIKDGAILACQSLLKSDVEVEVALGDEATALETVAAAITGVAPLTHDIVEMTLRLDAPAFATARAGQYLDVSAPGIAAARSYSLARAPRPDDGYAEVVFLIRHVPGGEFTDWLFGGDRRGVTLELSGPFGQFYRRGGSGRIIAIAGGSGLAPIHALLEQAERDGVTRDATVLFGARTQADLYYLDELAAIGAGWHGRFEVVPVLSEEPTDSGWQGARGLVTGAVSAVAREGGFRAGDEAYLCGPPPMVDAGIEALTAAGLGAEAIFYDKFLDASTQPGGRGAI
ncbi:MAG: 2Fe-2S iron-sulfur cluster-binding protein, partial [Gammaproteobacteria bacterium]